MVRISAARLNMEQGRIDQAILKDYGETLVGGAAGVSSGTSYAIDLSQGNVFHVVLNNNCIFTFTNPVASGSAGTFTLYLEQDGTGSRLATWPASVQWPRGAIPTLTKIANRVDILSFLSTDGGATWFGFAPTQDMPYQRHGPTYFGYFGGGSTGSPTLATVDRIDYGNDTATALVKGPLSGSKYTSSATGNFFFGYFGGAQGHGGGVGISTVDRIDYSNDAATAVAKGPLSVANFGLAATGTSAFGYFGSGTDGSGSYASIVDRVDYSNDTATAVAKGPLSAGRYGLAATGNSSFGYFGGGANPSILIIFSTVDRVDYSNDNATAIAKGPLSLARQLHAATGSSSFGYFGGGLSSTSRVDRIDYGNDTATALVKGPLSLARYYLAANGSSAFGYFGGGVTVSTVDRVDYSNDTATAVVKGPLSAARYGLTGVQHSVLS